VNKVLQSALANFEQRSGELFVAGRPISDLVKEHSTPIYLYDRSILSKRHRLLRELLPGNVKVYYAVKANPHQGLLRELGAMYDGVDIASHGEMMKALEAGIPAASMSFAGPGKSVEELRFAVVKGIGTISVESEREIEHIRGICAQLQKEARILLRVNPPFELARSGMKMGGGPKQFGIDSERIPDLLRDLRQGKWVHYEGLHIFAGSQNLSAEAIVNVFRDILEYAVSLTTSTNIAIGTLNLGGGFGIPYFANDADLDLERVGKRLAELLEVHRGKLHGTEFKIELGRFIAGECGLYVCQVLYRKISRGEVFLVVNGGMHHHLAASGNFGQSLVRRPMAMTVANRMNGPQEKVNVVGPLCTPLDTFGMGVELPHADEGDLIAIMNSGAYGFSSSPLGFLSHKPPKEILL
jgi:diaminopimelate decarboxylase